LLNPQEPPVLLTAELVTIMGLAAFGYAINEIADRAADERAGKRSRAAGLPRASQMTFLVITACGAVGVSLLWAADATAPTLVGVSLGLAAAYSVPPVRLKARGMLGLIGAAAAQWPIPILAVSAAKPDGWLSPAAWSTALLGLAFGMRWEAVHQSADAGVDRLAGVGTYVARGGSGWRVICAAFAAELGLLAATLALTWPRSRPALLVLVAWIVLGEGLPVGSRLRGYYGAPLAAYYFCLLPMTLALGRLSSPAFLALAGLLLALGWPHVHEHRRRGRSIRELRRVIPAGVPFILVDDDEWALEQTAELHPIPFIEHQGRYWGRPETTAHAISELERLRREGAGFLVVAWPAQWWLEYYEGLRRHLDRHDRRILENDRVVIFELGCVRDESHSRRLADPAPAPA
jgi:4-hydroxybenzoate polyprenyltransferase